MATDHPLISVVASLVHLWQISKTGHWNVVSPAFVGLHELYDEIASDAAKYADRFAERMRAIGLFVEVQVAFSSLLLDPEPGDGDYLRSMGVNLAAMVQLLEDMTVTVQPMGDGVTANLLLEAAETFGKWLWQVKAHGQTK